MPINRSNEYTELREKFKQAVLLPQKTRLRAGNYLFRGSLFQRPFANSQHMITHGEDYKLLKTLEMLNESTARLDVTNCLFSVAVPLAQKACSHIASFTNV